jgi:nicotinamide mononucleotide adenylyltransferase
MKPHLSVASVHGRFQPLHLEHMEYITKAFTRTSFLYIGITQYERANLQSVPGASRHRTDVDSNPLSFFERLTLIGLALDEIGVAKDTYAVVPFPIEKPGQLGDFLPVDVPVLTTWVEEWNQTKIELLQRNGYTVEVLFNRDPKTIAGSDIRACIAKDDDSWKSLVPAATVGYLESLDLPSRLI